MLDSLAPRVNLLRAEEVRRAWNVSFEGEDGIDAGGVHVDLITTACQDFEVNEG